MIHDRIFIFNDEVYTLTHTIDEASNHEDRVKVPLLVKISLFSSPESERETLSIPSVLNYPVEGESKLPVQEDLHK